jgi:hypothetical protein
MDGAVNTGLRGPIRPGVDCEALGRVSGARFQSTCAEASGRRREPAGPEVAALRPRSRSLARSSGATDGGWWTSCPRGTRGTFVILAGRATQRLLALPRPRRSEAGVLAALLCICPLGKPEGRELEQNGEKEARLDLDIKLKESLQLQIHGTRKNRSEITLSASQAKRVSSCRP